MGLDKERGFTIAELVVGLGLFSVVATSSMMFLTQHLRRLGTEIRITSSSQELRDSVKLLSSELRMGAIVSPYLPGNDPTVVNCKSQLSVTGTTAKFLVVHDDSSSGSGIKSYYVGYRYDSASKKLLRGAIASSSTTSCSVPAGDPTAANVALTVATNVIPIDANGDGANEPVFSYANSTLTVNLGTRIDPLDGTSVLQKVSTQIYVRTP